MKTKLFSLILLFSIIIVNAQEEYMDNLTEEVCKCLGNAKTENKEISEMEIGLCILVASQEYKEELARDYGIDWSNISKGGGEELGQIIGLKAIQKCPDLIVDIAQDLEDISEEELMVSEETTGIIQSIEDGEFIIFKLRDENFRNEKFYWLTFVDSNFDFQNSYKDLKGKKVKITYYLQELYDVRIKEYKLFNILDSIQVLEE